MLKHVSPQVADSKRAGVLKESRSLDGAPLKGTVAGGSHLTLIRRHRINQIRV